jgi:uncharacterized protein (DUF2141 family)
MMRSLSTAAFILLIVPGVLCAQAPQPASLEGVTLKTGTTEPVPRVRVTLVQDDFRLQTVTPVTTLSDDAGRFAFPNVPSGPYKLYASRDGYVKATYGASTMATPQIMLRPGQAVKNVVMAMTPTGAISGRIKNAHGDPMGNVVVRAERYAYEEGYKVLEQALTVITNDLGEYRLYFLQPGTYLVSASPDSGPFAQPDGTAYIGNVAKLPGNPFGRSRDWSSKMTLGELAALGVLSPADSGEIYLAAYYPGVTDPSLATAIDLRPGDNRSNTDFVVSSLSAVRIKGRISNIPAAVSPEEVSVMVSEIPGSVSASGEFEVRGVAPGKHDVVATFGELSEDLSFYGPGLSQGPASPPAPNPPPRLLAKTTVQVGSSDLNDVTLALSEGHRFNGRITAEGAAADKREALLKSLVVQIMPFPLSFETAPPPASVSADGSFTVKGVVSGHYQIQITGGDAAFGGMRAAYIKSAEMGGLDALNPTLVIDGEPRGELQIVLADERGIAAVTVVDEKQTPVPGARIVLVPDVPRRQHFDLYAVARASDGGKANVVIPPGDYTAYAWEEIQDGAWWDPDVLQKYQGRGRAVRISPTAPQTLELKAIPRQ